MKVDRVVFETSPAALSSAVHPRAQMLAATLLAANRRRIRKILCRCLPASSPVMLAANGIVTHLRVFDFPQAVSSKIPHNPIIFPAVLMPREEAADLIPHNDTSCVRGAGRDAQGGAHNVQ